MEQIARIPAAPAGWRHPLTAAVFRKSRRDYGTVVAPLAMFAHHRRLMLGYGALELTLQRSCRVPEELKALAELKAAMVAGCEWCMDFGPWIARRHGVGEQQLRALHGRGTLSAAEQDVVDFAAGLSASPAAVDEALFERLRARYDEGQLVELAAAIATENYRARFNQALGLAPQGFDREVADA